jgi:single-strand DNA-binding protein
MIYSNIIGRLGMDAEIKTSSKGTQYLSMRVASNDFIKGENVTTWIGVVWSGERALKLAEHMKKGVLLSIHGSLRTSLYKTKNGEAAISVDVLADRVDFAMSGGNSGDTQTTATVIEPQTVTVPTQVESAPQTMTSAVDNVIDDLPF